MATTARGHDIGQGRPIGDGTGLRVRPRGVTRGSRLRRHYMATTALVALVAAPPNLPGIMREASAGPAGGLVIGGQADIAQSGNTTTINQQSNRAIIEWDDFDIAPQEGVEFKQPGRSSIALNRVKSIDKTTIEGSLSANGQVWIVNPNGVHISGGASVDVGGLLATTADIDNDVFMGGGNSFETPGDPDAVVVNEGQITFGEAGLVGLVGPSAANHGVIQGRLGKVVVAGTETFAVDMAGDGILALPIGAADVVSASNTGQILNEGGTVLMDAAGAESLLEATVFAGGDIEARSVEVSQGTITLRSRFEITVAGRVDAAGGAGVDGGSIAITGDSVTVASGALVDASGGLGADGGDIRIGGDLRGAGPLPNAQVTEVQDLATIRADGGGAMGAGDGGTVIVWSDGPTTFAGDISVQGGPTGGDGGFAEVSGKVLDLTGSITLAAALGEAGELLLDPDFIVIGDADGAPGDPPPGGDIGFGDPGTYDPEITYLSPAFVTSVDGALTLQAVETIVVEQEVDGTGTDLTDLTLQTGTNGQIQVYAPITVPGTLTLDTTNATGTEVATTGPFFYGVELYADLTAGAIVITTGGGAGQDIEVAGGTTLTATTGTLDLRPGAGSALYLGIGGADVTLQAAGDIVLPLTYVGGAANFISTGGDITQAAGAGFYSADYEGSFPGFAVSFSAPNGEVVLTEEGNYFTRLDVIDSQRFEIEHESYNADAYNALSAGILVATDPAGSSSLGSTDIIDFVYDGTATQPQVDVAGDLYLGAPGAVVDIDIEVDGTLSFQTGFQLGMRYNSQITTGEDLALPATQVEGVAFFISTGGSITQQAGTAITAYGGVAGYYYAAVVASAAGAVTLTNTGNSFDAIAAIGDSLDVYVDVGATYYGVLNLAGAEITNNATVTADTIVVDGEYAALVAPYQSPGAALVEVGGDLTMTAQDIYIGYYEEGVTLAIEVSAGGLLDIDVPADTLYLYDAVTLTSGMGFEFPETYIDGTVTVQVTGGAVTQEAGTSIQQNSEAYFGYSGLVLDVPGNQVTLTNAGNNFSRIDVTSAGGVTIDSSLVDSGRARFEIGAANTTGDLSVTTDGQIYLDANDQTGTAVASTVGGDLSLTTTTAIEDAALVDLTVVGNTFLVAVDTGDAGTPGTITLDGGGTDFQGTVYAANFNTAVISDENAIDIAIGGGATVTIQANADGAGDDGTVTGYFIAYTNFAIYGDDVDLSGNYFSTDPYAFGQIVATDTAALSDTLGFGNVDIQAGGDITVTDGLIVGGIDLQSTGGDITVERVSSVQGIADGPFGGLAVSAGGDITLTDVSAEVVEVSEAFATGGDVTADRFVIDSFQVDGDITGTLSLGNGDVVDELVFAGTVGGLDLGPLALGDLTIPDGTLAAGGTLVLDGLTAGAVDVTVPNLRIGFLEATSLTATVDGDVLKVANADLSDPSGSTVTVNGPVFGAVPLSFISEPPDSTDLTFAPFTALFSTTGDVDVTSTGGGNFLLPRGVSGGADFHNDVAGALGLTGFATVVFEGAGDVTLDLAGITDLAIRGDADGSGDDGAILGTVDFTGTGTFVTPVDITLSGQFGTVEASADDVALSAIGSDIAVANSRVSSLLVDSDGAAPGTGTITVEDTEVTNALTLATTGPATLTGGLTRVAAGGDIVVTGFADLTAQDVQAGVLDVTADAVTVALADVATLDIDASAGGAADGATISDAVVAGDATVLSGAGPITLTRLDVGGNLVATGTGQVDGTDIISTGTQAFTGAPVNLTRIEGTDITVDSAGAATVLDVTASSLDLDTGGVTAVERVSVATFDIDAAGQSVTGDDIIVTGDSTIGAAQGVFDGLAIDGTASFLAGTTLAISEITAGTLEIGEGAGGGSDGFTGDVSVDIADIAGDLIVGTAGSITVSDLIVGGQTILAAGQDLSVTAVSVGDYAGIVPGALSIENAILGSEVDPGAVTSALALGFLTSDPDSATIALSNVNALDLDLSAIGDITATGVVTDGLLRLESLEGQISVAEVEGDPTELVAGTINDIDGSAFNDDFVIMAPGTVAGAAAVVAADPVTGPNIDGSEDIGITVGALIGDPDDPDIVGATVDPVAGTIGGEPGEGAVDRPGGDGEGVDPDGTTSILDETEERVVDQILAEDLIDEEQALAVPYFEFTEPAFALPRIDFGALFSASGNEALWTRGFADDEEAE
ncbi:MAG: filamentous hemagglutinin N-terminal domain-containing protein [Pseudomonadota bacterium]